VNGKKGILMKLINVERFNFLINSFKESKPILVVGDIGIDKYTSGDVKRISPEAPVPVLEVTEEWEKLGLASNVSDNLKSLGLNSTLCGVIGNDKRAEVLELLIEEKGLKTWGLLREENRLTTYKERITTKTQQICRVDYESKDPIKEDTRKRFNSRLNEFINDHAGLIIEDYGKGLLSEDLCQTLIKNFKDKGHFVAVDPSRQTPAQWYRGAHLLKPNRVEAELMVKHLGFPHTKSVDEMATILLDKLNLEKVLITLGSQGMALLDRKLGQKVEYIPTVANEVFDVSGAGDTVISIVTAAIVNGATLEEAAWLGNCAAGVVVSKRGTALCSIDELKDFYANLTRALIKKV
jgi:rfaE bifunctional protein kinase chain/domain